jgi:uncharacterized protein YgiM (DUF1202 family)
MALTLVVALLVALVPTVGTGGRQAAAQSSALRPGAYLGGGAYQMNGTVFGTPRDGLIGRQTASGYRLRGNDRLVALPACTQSSCPWLSFNERVPRWGKQTRCAERDGKCWVEIISPETGRCVVAPVLDVGPLFTNDNWWASSRDRTYKLARGRPAADVVARNGDVGFGRGASNIGFNVRRAGYSAGIDMAQGTWRDLGLGGGKGLHPLRVRLLWQVGLNHRQACRSGGSASRGSDNGGSAQSGGNATATDALNLRSQPNRTARVLAVIPERAAVKIRGAGRNGYYPVSYRGRTGWAAAEWLRASGARRSTADTAAAIATDSLNLRTGPSTADRVRTVLPRGALVTLTGRGSNGYLSVSYKGIQGWAYATYLSGGSPPSIKNVKVRTTDALNLRSGPSQGSRVLRTLPRGSRLTLTGESKNGFVGANVGGRKGWVAAQYLSGLPAATVSSPLNLRAGAALNSRVIAVIPRGTRVRLLGAPENGYVRIYTNGRSGFVYAAFLT